MSGLIIRSGFAIILLTGLNLFLTHVLENVAKELNASIFFALSLVAGLFPNWVFWELENIRRTKDTSPLPTTAPPGVSTPARWGESKQIVVFTVATLMAIWIPQAFIDAFDLLLTETGAVLNSEMRKVLMITFVGYCSFLFWLPTTAYVALSVGRRSSLGQPRWRVFFIAAAIGLGWPVAVGLYNSIVGGTTPDALSIVTLPGSSHPQFENRIKWTAYVFQLLGYFGIVILYSVHLRAFSWLGGTLQRRGWA